MGWPSVRNIDLARRKLAAKPTDKIQFHHTDALGFLAGNGVRFDYAMISYVIHEVEEKERTRLLQTLSSVTRNIILVDYLVPQPKGHRKILNTAIEFFAGWDHYRNFKSFVAGGGLIELLERAGLITLSELKNNPLSSHIVLAARKTGGQVQSIAEKA